MKILSAIQTRALDAFTIENEPIASIDLMERASIAFTENFIATFKRDSISKVLVFCGPGNNGGDGLAVSRLLLQNAYHAETYILHFTDKFSEDFSVNLKRLASTAGAHIHYIKDASQFPHLLEPDSIIIDAIFGTGLSRPASGLAAEIIDKINKTDLTVIALDVPSGLFTDEANNLDENAIIKADFTFTFQLPKLNFLLCDNYKFTGKWEVLDIGLSQKFIDEETVTEYFTITPALAKSILKPRSRCDHKGSYGHALIWAGSYGKIGAALLCAKACLRTGAGLTTAYIPKCGYEIFQTALPEVMVMTDPDKDFLTGIPDLKKFNSIAIGPGLDTESETAKAMFRLLEKTDFPVVIDADGLNILSQNPSKLNVLPEKSILTPHPKEFERLVGKCENDFERLQKAREFAKQHKCILILKSAFTSVNLPDGNTYFNLTGNPGIAKGGSGDVLTGILTALLAQKYSPVEAAVLGVYLHSLAGDIAAAEKSEWSMTAGDLVEKIGVGFKALLG